MLLRELWRKRVIEPIITLLKQGITPEKVVLSIASGAALGVIPVLGSTTILCALAAIIFRLNLVAIQIVNYLVYPLQFILLIPFFRAGEMLFSAEHLPLSLSQVVAMIKADIWSTIKFLWDTTFHALVVWCMIAPVVIVILYYLFLPLVRRLPFKSETAR